MAAPADDPLRPLKTPKPIAYASASTADSSKKPRWMLLVDRWTPIVLLLIFVFIAIFLVMCYRILRSIGPTPGGVGHFGCTTPIVTIRFA